MTDLKKDNKAPLLLNSITDSGNIGLITKMANEGANFENLDYRGRGPIHVAAINGDLKIIKLLVNDQKVNLNVPDKSGKSALCYACYHQKTKVAHFLFEKGAKLIFDKQNLINRIIQAGNEGELEFIKLLNFCKVDLRLSNYDKRTIGHLAAYKNQQ